MQRDLDIVLIDATNPWGYGRVFPAGLLREPRLGVRRAHLVLLTRCDQVPAESVDALDAEVKRLAPGVPVVRSRHIPLRLVNGNREAPTARLNGRPVSAFCGIGNPAAFYRTLQALGCRPAAFEVFPDHHCYSPADIERLHAWARRTSDDTWIVTTQKDLVKIQLETLGDRPLWAVAIALIPTEGQEALDAKLNGVLA